MFGLLKKKNRAANRKPKISVIVPLYKTEAYAETCIRSIMTQSMSEIEIICVDDASPDRVAAVVERLAREDARISLIRHDHNRGLGGARNSGIEAAQGDFIIGVDSDDWIHPGMMERLWVASGQGAADITTCGMAVVNDAGNVLYTVSPAEGSHRNDANQTDIFNFLKPSFCNKIIRRSLFTNHGILFPEHMYYEDLATTPRLVRHAQDIRAIRDPLYNYVRRDGSITQSASLRHIFDYFRVFDILSDFLIAEGLMDRYGEDLVKLIGDSLHYHTRTMTRGDAITDIDAQFMRYMIMMKIAYLDFGQDLRNADPEGFPQVLLKATSRDDLKTVLAANQRRPPVP